MPFSACPNNLGRLPSTRSGWSGGLVLALGDADADGILNRKTGRHAELEGILIYMGSKEHCEKEKEKKGLLPVRGLDILKAGRQIAVHPLPHRHGRGSNQARRGTCY